jgi:hypothetical protein
MVYHANEIKADSIMKGRTIVAKGKVDRVGRDILGSAYVTLGENQLTISRLQCMFATADETVVAELKPRQIIYVMGHMRGKMMNVIMDNCKVIP